MKRRILLVAAVVALVLVASAIYVSASAIPTLNDVRHTFNRGASDITRDDLARARSSLQHAHGALTSLPARLLGLVPFARQNLAAAERIAARGIPVIDAADRLSELQGESAEQAPFDEGAIDLESLTELELAAARLEETLTDLRDAAEESRSGWLLPPLWEGLGELSDNATSLAATVGRAQRLLAEAPSMLGSEEPRDYLVLLLNNAELRGAGGILSGAGTIRFDDGEISVGRFGYYVDLAKTSTRAQKVSAPPDLQRRFGRYGADTTTWINATASPDVPEVAAVTRDLYELATGRLVDGVMLIDPRGLAALLDPEQELTVPGTDLMVTGARLADFIYKDAYARFEDNVTRRETLLSLGPPILEEGLRELDRAKLERLGGAVAGGHFRFVSFSQREQDALSDLGIVGDLSRDAEGGIFISVQNLGADKLDPWIDREIDVSCAVRSAHMADCRVEVRLQNRAPAGLPLYVVQDKSQYALYEGYLEVYVPERAIVTKYSLDGSAPRTYTEQEDGRTSLGANIEIERGITATAVAAYRIPLDSGFDLALTPQPLSHDARVNVVIEVPDGWSLEGPSGTASGRYQGSLTRTLLFTAGPVRDDSSGITRMWRTLRDFWTEPFRF